MLMSDSWYRGVSIDFVCRGVFFCKQKTAYEMRISDWSSDVCSSDLADRRHGLVGGEEVGHQLLQDRAFQIFAHPARPMAAAQHDRVMAVHRKLVPAAGRPEGGAGDHLGIGAAGILVGAQPPADHRYPPDQRDRTPWIQPARNGVAWGRRWAE